MQNVNGNAWCHPEFIRRRGWRTSERILWKRQTRPVVCLNTGDLEGFNNEHVYYVPGENHRPAASHWQMLSQTVCDQKYCHM